MSNQKPTGVAKKIELLLLSGFNLSFLFFLGLEFPRTFLFPCCVCYWSFCFGIVAPYKVEFCMFCLHVQCGSGSWWLLISEGVI